MKNTVTVPEQKGPFLTLSSHTITWKQDLSSLKKKLPIHAINTFLDLHSLAQKKPKRAKRKMETFLQEYPNHPEVMNLLTFVYLCCRKVRRANRLIEQNYEKNPDNLLAKINFADLCLRRKKAQLIPKIFDHTFDLQLLYPKRKVFHISEFRGFMNLMGFYELSIGNKEKAEGYHYLSARLDPHHPGAKFLAKKIRAKSSACGKGWKLGRWLCPRRKEA